MKFFNEQFISQLNARIKRYVSFWPTMFSSKPVLLDIFFFCLILLIFVLLDWRLFAFGSANQLFLYGDILTYLNNTYYLFENFSIHDIFSTFISRHGMMGGYLMSIPGSSLFYPGIFLLLPIYKLFHMNISGLYYLTLAAHTIHFILGAFFIYKILNRVFGIERTWSFIGSVVYIGFAWNISWFGVNLVGLIPLTIFLFLRYLQTRSRIYYLAFVSALALFLYAGAIVNFFFYLWFNLLLIFSLSIFWRIDTLFLRRSHKDTIWQYILLFVIAPIWSLSIYAVQLVSTYIVSGDIIHTEGGYDALALFGSRFYDVMGLLIPSFGMLNFGIQTNPQWLIQFLGTEAFYIGIIPIILLALSFSLLKDKRVAMIWVLLFVNFLLVFGGSTVLYDITYFFPGNSFFRGHSKYLAFFGIYISFLASFALRGIVHNKTSIVNFHRIQRVFMFLLGGIGFVAVLCVFLSFVFAVLRVSDPRMSDYYNLATTFSNYFFRSIIFSGISLVALNIFFKRRSLSAYVLVVMVLLIDVSVNYKHQSLSLVQFEDLTSKSFFQCCQNKTVVSNLDGFSQIYLTPELSGVDAVRSYDAMPNKYLLRYQDFFFNKDGSLNIDALRIAGVDGFLTQTNLVPSQEYSLSHKKEITEKNYKQILWYNAHGITELHNDWGYNQSLIGSRFNYYSINDSKKAIFSYVYREIGEDVDIEDEFKQGNFNLEKPLVLNPGISRKRTYDSIKNSEIPSTTEDVDLVVNTPTYKKFQFQSAKEGLFTVNIPYSNIWVARLNGSVVPIYRTNYAFLGVKVDSSGEHSLEIFLDRTPIYKALIVSVISSLMLFGGFLYSLRKIQ